MKRGGVFLSLLSCLCITSAQVSRSCREYTTCGQCMEAGPHCGWCSQEEFKVIERCDVKDNLLKNGCDPTHIESAPSSIAFNKKNPPKNADRNTEAVQLSPQEITIKLRPNGPFSFPVQFRLAEDYPVDLYYIMDLSDSMKDDKDKLAQLGDLLAAQMNNITKNFQLGFGSFVDKKTMPYVSIKPDDLKSPCDHCTSPYGFRNQLSLTEDTAQFKTKVNETQISGNLDSPEGGFDAIMQSVVCHSEIGWRSQSRKMLLFSTDAGFHHAGDGKLGGIVVPNDMSCHLDETGEYTKSLEQDYPSISQLAMKIAENKVNIIFAVVADQRDVYGNLSTFIEGSTVGVLDHDSSNIVQLVKDNYDKISSNVEMRTEQDEDFTVSFSTTCLGSETKGNRCDNIKIGNSVTFDVTVSATSCPKNREHWKKSFYIYPVGLSEKLKVNVELICECGCEVNGSKEVSPKCENQGTYQCGACICNDGMYGRTCECDGTKAPDGDFDGTCKEVETSKVCSGHGQCVCGICDCGSINPFEPSKRYSGKYCQCNDYNCDYEDGMLCGGPERGICNCSKCVCNEGFDGSGCGCSKSNQSCLAKDGSICNNKGRCECGKCTCTELSYKGKTCEECPTCPSACDERRACVLCGAFKNYNKLSAEKCSEDCPVVGLVDDLDSLNDTLWNPCKFRDESDDCDIIFKWHQITNEIKVQKTKVCPTPVNILAIVLSVIGGIIFIGLLLLILGKILVTIHDRREFARFEKERENAKWDMGENPIYKQATSTYKNPTYNKS